MAEAAAEWHRLEDQWGPTVQAVVAGTLGDPTAQEAVRTAFDVWEEHGWEVSEAFRRIWQGERDWRELTEGLNRRSVTVVLRVLQMLGVATPRAELASVRDMAPLVSGVVSCSRGDETLRPAVDEALADLEGREEWRQLSAALGEILAGERDRETLLIDLDAVDTTLVELALDCLTGDEGAATKLAELDRKAQRRAMQQAEQIRAAIAAWLQTPAGMAAQQTVQGEGLEGEEAFDALLRRFIRSQQKKQR
jgi:hypothetical protein